ncbi:MAG: P-loop ATPase, Sll1717 family [Leptolyngbyaceae cyanobacterium]
MRLDIRELNLGSDSAERDINLGLAEYFYPNATYQKFLSGRKTILVGNRGAGKSAIFKYIAATETRKGHLVLELSPEEYAYELLADHLASEEDGFWRKQSAYSVAWQYLLYTLIFKNIAQTKRGLLIGATKNIYSYVASKKLAQQTSSIITLVDYLKRIEQVKTGVEGLRSQRLQALYSLDEIKTLIPSLQNVLKSTKIKILIDELDKGCDNSEDAKFFIAGLFQATQKLNLISPNLRVFISIRQELFDNIPQIYEDAQKIREDVEVIRWGKNELLELIGRRIVHSFPQANRLNASKLWQSVFVAQMQSTGTETLDYIIERTQLRPRELLQFCKLCAERIEYSLAERRIDEAAIAAAEESYSEQKTRDLASEYRFQYPHLLDVFEIFRGTRSHYNKEGLDYLLLAIVCGEYDVEQAATWILDMDYLELKQILWKIGFLKAWVPRHTNRQTSLAGAYLGHYEVPTINLENIERFRIHPACTSFLHLKKPTS